MLHQTYQRVHHCFPHGFKYVLQQAFSESLSVFKHAFALPFLPKNTMAKNDLSGADLELIAGFPSGSVVADEKSVVRPSVNCLLANSLPQGSTDVPSIQVHLLTLYLTFLYCLISFFFSEFQKLL